MQNLGPVAGTPLVPLWAIVLLIIGLVIFRRFRLKLLIPGIIGIAIILVILLPSPKVAGLGPKDLSKVGLNGSITVNFDRPVGRRVIQKSIEPAVDGVWIFEKPTYSTHLYRAVTFYPARTLSPNTNYKVTLSNIRNTIQRSKPYEYTFDFTTQDLPKVKEVISEGEKLRVLLDSPNDRVSEFISGSEMKLSDNKMEYIVNTNDLGNLVVKRVDLVWDLNNNNIIGRSEPIVVFSSGEASAPSKAPEIKVQENVTKIEVPVYLQQHTLSCEVATLRMALAYRGINVSEGELLDKVGFDPTPHSGSTWGDPYERFVGNVDGRQMVSGYGVYWDPIARVANIYRNAEAFTGASVTRVTESILSGNPAIIWAYSKNGSPTYWNTPQGKRIYAVAGEHTVVVVGFVGEKDNPTQVIVNDPLIGQVYWNRSTFDQKFKSFSGSGVIVY